MGLRDTLRRWYSTLPWLDNTDVSKEDEDDGRGVGEPIEVECGRPHEAGLIILDSVTNGRVKELDTPRVGWRCGRGTIARVIIPAGATIVKPRHSRKMRADRVYIDKVMDDWQDVIVGPHSGYTYREGHLYYVSELNTDVDIECGADGIYFWPNKVCALAHS